MNGATKRTAQDPFAEVYPVATLTDAEYSAAEKYLGIYNLARSLKNRGINAKIEETRNLGLGTWEIRLVIKR